MSQYVVTTKNPNFSGRVAGVRFEKGRAFVSEFTIDPGLGRDTDEIATILEKDFHYKVEKVESEQAPVVQYIYAAPPPPVPEGPAAVDPVTEEAAEETPKAPRKRGGK